jgi:hypothetical protein
MQTARRQLLFAPVFTFLRNDVHATRGESLRNDLQAARVSVLKVTNEQMNLIYGVFLSGLQLKWFKERNKDNFKIAWFTRTF